MENSCINFTIIQKIKRLKFVEIVQIKQTQSIVFIYSI